MQGCKLVLEEYRIRKQVCEGSGVADSESDSESSEPTSEAGLETQPPAVAGTSAA